MRGKKERKESKRRAKCEKDRTRKKASFKVLRTIAPVTKPPTSGTSDRTQQLNRVL
jgi:hypothetical protein